MTTEPPTPESETAQALSEAQEKALKESLADASVLLWYATREGKEVSKEAVDHIVKARSVLTAGTPDSEVEGRFWVALRELATAVRPASIDSILATYSYPFGDYGKAGKRRFTDPVATKKNYSIASVLILVVLMVVQVWWFIGTTWRTDLETNRAELDRIAGSLREMRLDVKADFDLASIKHQQLLDLDQGFTGIVDGSHPDHTRASVDKLTNEIEELKNKQDQTELKYANVTLRGARVKKMLDGNYRMLDWWDFVTEWIPDKQADGAAGGQAGGALVRAAPGTAGASGSAGQRLLIGGNDGDSLLAELMDEAGFLQTLVDGARALEAQQLGVEDALVSSKSTLAILSQYVLPLLYGLLGSLAYILRTLSSEIQNVTFTRGSEIRYSLRWPLGMLGGVTAGLFFDPAELSGVAVITPLGLAFLAGYGVELLFTGLDRIVRAFTSEDGARSKAA